MAFPISPVSSSSCSSASRPRGKGEIYGEQQQRKQQQSQHDHPNTEISQEQQIAEEQLVAMLHIESQYKVNTAQCRQRPSFLLSSLEETSGSPHEEWRRKICEWSFKVVDHFRYDREVVSVAMNIFDRFLSKSQQQSSCSSSFHPPQYHFHKQQQQQQKGASPTCAGSASFDTVSSSSSSCYCFSCHQTPIDSRVFQLSAMTSLYLAIKLSSDNNNDYEYDEYGETDEKLSDGNKHVFQTNRRKKLRLLSFVDLSRGQFTPQDISTMEQNILNLLEWKVNPTTPMTLVAQLLTCMPLPLQEDAQRNHDLVLHVINELSRYITELSVCLANIACVYQPSQVAYASILISMDMLTLKALPLDVRAQFFELVADTTAFCNGVTLHPNDETIYYLKECLKRSFLPEVLMEDINMEPQHPVYIAREAGLLDLAFLNHAAASLDANLDATSAVPTTTGSPSSNNILGRNTSSTFVTEQQIQNMHLQQGQQRRILCVTP